MVSPQIIYAISISQRKQLFGLNHSSLVHSQDNYSTAGLFKVSTN